MRKHGWRTPEWMLVGALEPGFHFKPAIELYNLVSDPLELHNVVDREPEVVALLQARMRRWIARREQETGRTNPMFTNPDWRGHGAGPFQTSQQASTTPCMLAGRGRRRGCRPRASVRGRRDARGAGNRFGAGASGRVG